MRQQFIFGFFCIYLSKRPFAIIRLGATSDTLLRYKRSGYNWSGFFKMSPFTWLIVLVVFASVFALAAYLLVIKYYYWSGTKRDPRRKK
jgi:hypothetical protein